MTTLYKSQLTRTKDDSYERTPRKPIKHSIYDRKKENFKEHIHAHVRPFWSAHVTPSNEYLEQKNEAAN